MYCKDLPYMDLPYMELSRGHSHHVLMWADWFIVQHLRPVDFDSFRDFYMFILSH